MISGLVADRLDDEREDGDGQDERREQQVQLRDHPDGDAAADDGERPVLAPPRRASPGPGLFSASSLLAGHVRPRGARRRRSRQEPGTAPCTRGSQRPRQSSPPPRTSRGRRRDREGPAVCGSSRRFPQRWQSMRVWTGGTFTTSRRTRPGRHDIGNGDQARRRGVCGCTETRTPGRRRTVAQAASPEWNDATSSPPKNSSHGPAGPPPPGLRRGLAEAPQASQSGAKAEMPSIEGGILSTNWDHGQARPADSRRSCALFKCVRVADARQPSCRRQRGNTSSTHLSVTVHTPGSDIDVLCPTPRTRIRRFGPASASNTRCE